MLLKRNAEVSLMTLNLINTNVKSVQSTIATTVAIRYSLIDLGQFFNVRPNSDKGNLLLMINKIDETRIEISISRDTINIEVELAADTDIFRIARINEKKLNSTTVFINTKFR